MDGAGDGEFEVDTRGRYLSRDVSPNIGCLQDLFICSCHDVGQCLHLNRYYDHIDHYTSISSDAMYVTYVNSGRG